MSKNANRVKYLETCLRDLQIMFSDNISDEPQKKDAAWIHLCLSIESMFAGEYNPSPEAEASD